MARRPGRVGERLRHERRGHAGGRREVAHRELEQDVAVGHLERPLVLEVDLPLAEAPLHLAGPRAEVRRRRAPRARRAKKRLVLVAGLDRVVGARERGRPQRLVPVRAAVVVRAAVQRELELARDLRGEAGAREALDLPAQDRPRRHRRRGRRGPSRRSRRRRSRCGPATRRGAACRGRARGGRRASRCGGPCTPAPGPGHWSTSQPEHARAERDALVQEPAEDVDGEKRLPTSRPVTSADVTITVRMPVGLQVVGARALGRHRVSHPPSTGSCAPVMNDASSESRNEIAAATSSGSPTAVDQQALRHERPRLGRAQVAAGDERGRDRSGRDGVHADAPVRRARPRAPS